MKLNPLSEALARAEKKKPFLPLPQTPPPKPVESAPAPPTVLKKVEGGLVVRKPVNRQAALVTARASWWALPPYVPPEISKTETVPELKAKLDRAHDWIKKLEQISTKLREQLKQAKEQAEIETAKNQRSLSAASAEKAKMERELAELRRKVSISEVWT